MARSGDSARAAGNPSWGDGRRPRHARIPLESGVRQGGSDASVEEPQVVSLLTTLALLAAWVGGNRVAPHAVGLVAAG